MTNPKPITMWCIEGPLKGRGRFLAAWTIRTSHSESVSVFCDDTVSIKPWRYWRDRGYRAVKVKVEKMDG